MMNPTNMDEVSMLTTRKRTIIGRGITYDEQQSAPLSSMVAMKMASQPLLAANLLVTVVR